jgi:hypothetical protein
MVRWEYGGTLEGKMKRRCQADEKVTVMQQLSRKAYQNDSSLRMALRRAARLLVAYGRMVSEINRWKVEHKTCHSDQSNGVSKAFTFFRFQLKMGCLALASKTGKAEVSALTGCMLLLQGLRSIDAVDRRRHSITCSTDKAWNNTI